MSQYNNDATLDIAIEPRHHATLKEKTLGSAQILQGKITGNTEKKAAGQIKKYGHLDHTFGKQTRAQVSAAKTPESRRDLIRQAEAGQRDFEDGLGDVEGTLRGNPSKGAFGHAATAKDMRKPSLEVERTISDESVTSTTTSETSASDISGTGR